MSGIRRSTIRTFGRSFLLSFGLGLLIPLQAIAAPVTISIGDAMVPEGNAGTTDLLFNVQREAGSDLGSNVVIPYGVLPSGVHPATAGVDYVAPPDDAGSLRIPLGQSVATLHVPVIGDTKPESNETLQVQFGKAAAFVPGIKFLNGPPSLPVGTAPQSVAAGDFNGDRQPDLAVANPGSNNVSVLLGDGAGNFAPQKVFAAGQSPVAVATGDFNGDGKLDLVTANTDGNDVSVLLGDGAGGFSAPVSFAVGQNPYFLAVGDFNGDNKPDLAVANSGSNTISILLGGAGGFTLAGTYDVGTPAPDGVYPLYIISADFNGDRKPDLAVSSYNRNVVSVLLGNGAGGFGRARLFPVGTQPLAMAAGDFDGDSYPDLAVVNAGDNSVSILVGDGLGGFGLPVDYLVGQIPTSVATADFNGDQVLDLAVTGGNDASVTVLLGDGFGNFATESFKYFSGALPASVAIADFDGDGNPDLAVANTADNSVAVLRGLGGGVFAGGGTFPTGDEPVASVAGDFNGDGKLDLALVTYRDRRVSIALGTGGGGFVGQGLYSVGSRPESIAGGDIDHDAQLDLAVANSGDNTVTVFRGNGAGSFSLVGNVSVGASPNTVALADINGDGNLDLITSDDAGNDVTLCLGDGRGGFGAKILYSVGTRPLGLTIGDFNGDGKLDVATANASSDNVSVLLNNGAGGFATARTFAVSNNPSAIDAGDFDEDGKLDLAVHDGGPDFSGISYVGILKGNGAGGFAAPVHFNLPTNGGGFGLIARDLDGDGHLDVAVTNLTNNGNASKTVSVLRGDGTGKLAAPVSLAVGNAPNQITAADFDGDGDLDLAVPNLTDKSLSILINQSARPVAELNGGTATGTILDDDGTDTTPDAFRFTDLIGAPISTSLRSNSITVSGITAAAPLVLSGPADAVPQYSINGAGFKYYNLGKGQPTVSNGDTVQLRARTSATGGATVDLVLSIGSVSDTWSLTTATTASTPNAFDFKDKTNQPANRYIGSGGVRISGINTPVAISINGDPSASFRINSGGYIAGPATVSNGDLVVLRLKSSATPGTSVSAVVSIGGVTDRWTVTTAP